MRKTIAYRFRFRLWFPIMVCMGISVSLVHLVRGPVLMEDGGSGEKVIILLLLLLHLLWLLPTVPAAKGTAAAKLRRLRRGSGFLLVPSLLFFLFAIIYAANANMTYAQWFAQTSGNLHLAPDSAIQRLNALLRFGPLLLIDLVSYIAVRLHFSDPRGAGGRTGGLIGKWQVLMALFSAAAVTLAFPSPVFPGGCAFLAYLAPIPLLLVLSEASFPGALFSGIAYGTLQALLGNYWLGTYDLLTLHFVTFFHAAIFLLFIPLLLMLSRSLPGLLGRRLRLPLIALLWVAFDFIRSGGFLGYPWGILGSSQYKVLPVIQSASVFGIWGVNLFVWLTAALITGILIRKKRGEAFRGELFGLSFLVIMVMMTGALQLRHWEALPPEKHIDVALIQQNTDPRKNDYAQTLGVLKKLSLEAVAQFEDGPDLVAWSETAFVPNLRKWGAMDPDKHPNAALAHDFLAFQKDLGVWLLTGNDDYEEPDPDDPDDEGRKHYNAAVLFSDRGERIATYRKQHLVPFSESFPYEQEFPLIYKLLLEFDSTFWEAGDSPVVFHHPSADFITPICFEDSFPGEIADQVNLGVDLILNISNDFWSLTETEGEQHGANSIFRAVESRRPLLRSTASGLTCVVSPSGRILEQLPHYEEGYISARVNLYGRKDTFYLRRTDLLPKAIIGLALILFSAAVVRGLSLALKWFLKPRA